MTLNHRQNKSNPVVSIRRSSEEKKDESTNVCLENILSLTTVARINENMKTIVNGSNSLYVIALNAMFASRAITNGANGFVEVTALLRNFSQRLDAQVSAIQIQIDSLIYQSAVMIKKQKHNKLLQEAIYLSDSVHIPEHVRENNKKLCEEIETFIANFTMQISRCEMLMKLGENLSVLAKVEAAATEDGAISLTPITQVMAETINHISDSLLDSKNIIAA